MYNDIYKCNRDGNDKKMNSFNRKIHNQNDPPSILIATTLIAYIIVP